MSTKLYVDPGTQETHVTIVLEGTDNPRDSRKLREIIAAARPAEVHVNARGLGGATADVLAEHLRGSFPIIARYDGKNPFA